MIAPIQLLRFNPGECYVGCALLFGLGYLCLLLYDIRRDERSRQECREELEMLKRELEEVGPNERD